jgi:hypothetical protein
MGTGLYMSKVQKQIEQFRNQFINKRGSNNSNSKNNNGNRFVTKRPSNSNEQRALSPSAHIELKVKTQFNKRSSPDRKG